MAVLRHTPTLPAGQVPQTETPRLYVDAVSDVGPSARVAVRVTPRAGRNELTGVRDDGTILARVTAAPSDGEANAALCRLIAKKAGVPPSSVAVVRGHRSREKTVELPAAGGERLVREAGGGSR